MQKTIKILFDVVDERYREQFNGLMDSEREIQIPSSMKPILNDFIADWITVFEKYSIPTNAIVVKYVGERLYFE